MIFLLLSPNCHKSLFLLEPPPGLEPGTYSLRVDGPCVASRVRHHLQGFLLELVFPAPFEFN